MENKKSLANKIFDFLESSSIKYVLLRDHLALDRVLSDDNLCDEDIDLYIESSRRSEFFDFLVSQNFFHMLPSNLFFNVNTGLKIDTHFDNYLRMPFPDKNFFLENIEQIDGLPFLKKRILFLILLLHPLDLSGFRGHRRYTEDKLEFFHTHKKLILDHQVKDYICEWLGSAFYQKIKYLFLKDPKLLFDQYLYLKLIAIFQSKTLLKHQFKRLSRKVNEIFKSRGFLISVMGIDGSGKTTLTQNLHKSLNMYFSHKPAEIIYMGMLGPYILPIQKLSNIYRSLFNTKPLNQDPKISNEFKGVKFSERVKSIIIISLIGLDLFIRNLVVIWKIFFLNRILITDRSIFDQHTQYNTSFILKLIRAISLKPSFFIFLNGNVEKIYRRKLEYSPEDLQLHQNLHLNFLKNNFEKDLVIVNADKSKDLVLSDVLKKVTKKYNESY